MNMKFHLSRWTGAVATLVMPMATTQEPAEAVQTQVPSKVPHGA